MTQEKKSGNEEKQKNCQVISYDRGEINNRKDKNASERNENVSKQKEILRKYIEKITSRILFQNCFTSTSLT